MSRNYHVTVTKELIRASASVRNHVIQLDIHLLQCLTHQKYTTANKRQVYMTQIYVQGEAIRITATAAEKCPGNWNDVDRNL